MDALADTGATSLFAAEYGHPSGAEEAPLALR